MTPFGPASLAPVRNFVAAATVLLAAPNAWAQDGAECALGFDAGGFIGLSTEARNTGDGLSLEGDLDAVGGAQWGGCLPIVPRIEVAFGTTTRGPPWGDGVRAVEVKSLTLDTRLRVGAGWIFLESESKSLGLELLAGPQLRITRVKTTITGNASTGREATAHLEVGGGLVASLNGWRLRLRAWGVLPGDRELTVGVGIAHAL